MNTIPLHAFTSWLQQLLHNSRMNHPWIGIDSIVRIEQIAAYISPYIEKESLDDYQYDSNLYLQ